MSPPKKQRCVGGGRDGELITTGADQQACIKEEGRPTDIDQAPGQGQQRITEDLFDSMALGGQRSRVRTAERVVLHPLCSIHQRHPGGELLNRLDTVNLEFGEEVARLTADDGDLRNAIMQLVLDMSDLAAAAIEAEGSAEPSGFGITDEFLERAERIAGDLGDRTTEPRLQRELEGLVDQARQLRGVPPSELITVLGGESSTSY